MNVKSDDSGFEQFQQSYEKAKSGLPNVPINDLFTSSFMSANTKFSSIMELLTASGVTMDSPVSIPDADAGKLNNFVSANSKFSSWNEMSQVAFAEYLKSKI